MSEIHLPGMELEAATYHCPQCDCDIALANQLTHEVACARMQRNNNQRAPAAQPIVRQSSSSAISDQIDNQPRAQSIPKREDRRIVENRLVACPNCGKSVREQEINSHMDDECLKNEMIPCEFCDETIPMSDYSSHVDGCQRRSQNQQSNNNRARSPVRERPNIMEEESDDIPQEESPSERDRSPERGSSQGGIRGFLRHLADSATTQLRQYNENLQRQVQEREQQREEQERRQQEMLQHMWGQPQVPRNPLANQLVPHGGSNGGSRVIRTVERGPGGSVIVRSRVVPAAGMPSHPMQMNGMGMDPMELLFGLMSGRGGMLALNNSEMGQAPEETGLKKEDIDSLALVKYSKEMNKNVDEESKKCPICLDQFEEGQEVRFLWCTHRFHRTCVDQWLDKHTNCPICKKDFSEAEQGFSP